MRLRKIKLAGFKSFVEPTTLQVSDNLVGVVGPNGCGKSNIIDAVTWVMGESSARHLRGDALTDVIFNGSGARQPVGQAVVELVFDNSSGKLGGAYAKYREISIKRQLDRDAISAYYLNGTRCRRKDVQGIFLGTGLGPRSYSIIEQGVISRLIEARPEELRVFLEEAAGISKFKERRRETENRIRHTRDNMSRINDIVEELNKQLEHLHRQAKAAERFKTLKQEERQLQAELLALEWKDLAADAEEQLGTVRVRETRVEEGMAALRKVEAGIETQRESYHAATESLNQAQADFYQAGSDIAQLEQSIEHGRERIEALKEEADKAGRSKQELLQQLEDDTRELNAMTAQAGALAPRLESAKAAGNDAHDALRQAEEAWQTLQGQWEDLNHSLADLDKRIEVNATRKELLQTGLNTLAQRRDALLQEIETLDPQGLEEELAQLSKSGREAENLLEDGKRELHESAAGLQGRRGAVTDINERLRELRVDYQKNESKLASLEALQREETLEDTETLGRWLAALGLEDVPRLIDEIEVEQEWELALETVISQRLQDVRVPELPRGAVEQAPASGSAGFLLDHAEAVNYTPKPRPRLIDKISATAPLDAILNRIYLADNPEQAQELCKELDETESVVTRDGLWMNNYWMRIRRRADATPGPLAREQALSRLKNIRQQQEQEISRLEDELAQQHGLIDTEERRHDEILAQVDARQEAAVAGRTQFMALQTRHEQTRERRARLERELLELRGRESNDQAEADSLEPLLAQDRQAREQLLTQRQDLEAVRSAHDQALTEARAHWQGANTDSHALALQAEAARTKKTSFEQSIKRCESQLAALEERIRELDKAGAAQREPLQQLGDELDLELARKLGLETTLSAARETVQAREQGLRDAEQARGEQELALQELRAELEQVRIRHQELQVRLQTLDERLQAVEHAPQALLATLDERADAPQWQQQLSLVQNRIQRLGAINLAAIDEYQQLSERKQYLDSQHADLATALETLEGAIHKINKETRARFKDTFERLDANLRETFPLLFGGGQARLEMTDQDLLETGITVMARPPGKKNSNIHLLSGGEKALTAVALVFSIFKLNPAPFCILDEVDAPLDDHNAARFSDMLKAMSEEVQFIIVTHNKITMESVRQLLGVTMHEAGVSRLVSVDIDEAVEIAASA